MIEEISVTTHAPAETIRLAKVLGKLLQAGDVVLLAGDLGAGKTLFSKGVANGLGVVDEVTSPTYALVAEYDGREHFVHMDLYRLYGDDADMTLADDVLAGISFDDYIEGPSVLLIEWPAGITHRIDDALSIRITAQPLPRVDEREFYCVATGPKSVERLRRWVTTWLSS